jgi:hypothetical protein
MYNSSYTQTLQDQIGQLSKLLGAQGASPPAFPEAPQASQAANPFDCVDGLEGARAFLSKMLASTRHIVWDNQKSVFYVLQKDANGNPARIQICPFTVELEPTMEEKYVTRDDFNALVQKLDQLISKEAKDNG